MVTLANKTDLHRYSPYLFIGPAFIILILGLLVPFFYGVGLSLYNFTFTNIRKTPDFYGLGNYFELFKDPYFWQSIWITFIFTFIVTLGELLYGLVIALVLEEDVYGMRFWRSAFVLPFMIAPVVVGIIWRYLFDSNFGIINYVLSVIGIAPKLWLSDPHLALISIIIADIWQWTPFVFLMLLAGLQGIPEDLVSAGKIDGANYFQNLIHIKLACIRNVLVVTAAMRIIDAFRSMVVVYNMTYGGPGKSTEILSLSVYKTGFVEQRLGKASAVAVVLMVLIYVVTSLVFFKSQEDERN